MRALLKFVLAFGLSFIVTSASVAQSFFVAPQVNVGLSVATARDYANPEVGYGLQLGYRLINRWMVVAGYDHYRFSVDAPISRLANVSPIFANPGFPEILPLDMNNQAWNTGVRYTLPYSRLIPFIGLSASTNLLEVEGFGLSISRRYWGVAPIIGAELPITSRWSLQADARLQTIFVRGNIPFFQEVVKEHFVFIPVQAGVVFYVVK